MKAHALGASLVDANFWIAYFRSSTLLDLHLGQAKFFPSPLKVFLQFKHLYYAKLASSEISAPKGRQHCTCLYRQVIIQTSALSRKVLSISPDKNRVL